MEETITVGELIKQLSKYSEDKEVIASSVGFNARDSYDFTLDFGDLTVDEYNGVIRINFSTLQ